MRLEEWLFNSEKKRLKKKNYCKFNKNQKKHKVQNGFVCTAKKAGICRYWEYPNVWDNKICYFNWDCFCVELNANLNAVISEEK